METAVLIEMGKGVAPALLCGLAGCAALSLARKVKPIADTGSAWIGALALGLGCALGAAWSGGTWKPGPSGTSWLCAMAVVAGVAGLIRGESERAGVAQWGLRAVALAAVAWMTVRSVAAMSDAERVVIIAGLALAGSAVCSGLERGVKEAAPKRGGWPSAATGLICGFATCQVLIIGMEVHTAAWMAAGVSAFFGVCLVAGFVTRRAIVGRGVMAAAGVLLCGLMLHGAVLRDRASSVEVGLYASLLVISAVGPVVAARVLGERGRGWGGVMACAVPAVAAVVMAVIVRPPPMEL